jgi:hypothetical protein
MLTVVAGCRRHYHGIALLLLPSPILSTEDSVNHFLLSTIGACVASLAVLVPCHVADRSAEPLPPTGLFVCRGPSQTPDREVDFPFIKGWLVRPRWNKVEPKEGRYDWSFIEKEIEIAKRLKRKIILAILGGPQTPPWVYDAGVPSFDFKIRDWENKETTEKIPVLWDETYLKKWTALVKAMGKRFADEETIVLVHITGATENGMEMQLPHTDADLPNWRKAGYKPEKAIDAWKHLIDAYAAAFPNKPLDLDIHPVLGDDQVAREAAAYGHDKLGARFGITGGWISGKGPRDDPHHAPMHPIAKKYGALGFQMIASQMRQPEQFADGKLKNAVEQGMGWGASYFEVWELDAMDPKMHPVLKEVAATLEKAAAEKKNRD